MGTHLHSCGRLRRKLFGKYNLLLLWGIRNRKWSLLYRWSLLRNYMQNRRGNMPTEAGPSYFFYCRLYHAYTVYYCNILLFSKKPSGFTGPSTSTIVTSITINGQLNNVQRVGNVVPVTEFGRCDRSRFEVVNPGSVPVPAICGENSGEHSMSFIPRLPGWHYFRFIK